ncbi:fibrosin-1-like protein [Osmerus mordax]|uniref:fibrosin-1-like protein n=1 Tax=Osmerus mordax TaxID=8014 RepID=UPI00350EB1A0
MSDHCVVVPGAETLSATSEKPQSFREGVGSVVDDAIDCKRTHECLSSSTIAEEEVMSQETQPTTRPRSSRKPPGVRTVGLAVRGGVSETRVDSVVSSKLSRVSQIKPLVLRPVRLSEDEAVQELNRPHRSTSKERLSESSPLSLSGRGYSCDSERDIDDKVSDVGSEKLFSPTTPKGAPTNESPESKTCSSAKVSGLQRSQEQSDEAPFAPPAPSPTPASPPTGSPAPAAAAAPPPPRARVRLASPPPLSVKRESAALPPIPTPPLLRTHHHPHPHPHQELRVLPSPQHHARPLIGHQLHHPLQYNSLHDISHSHSSPLGLPKHHLSPSPHHHLPPSPHHHLPPSPAPRPCPCP